MVIALRSIGTLVAYQQHEHELVLLQPDPQHELAPGSGRQLSGATRAVRP
jgi:hypothetical protein